ncbi:MAG TPA: hypothetical protein VN428_19155 [Bryobacteraceae bacterium]|nr:hypothetical protein [Bryobacteraceae bacterium]
MQANRLWAALMFCALAVPAQQSTEQTAANQPAGDNVRQAELSVPFGVVPGKLIKSGQYLIFVDDEQPGDSFVVPRRELANARREGETLRVDLNEPVRDRSGERRSLVFRLSDPASAAPLLSWMQSAPAAGAAAGPASASARTDEPATANAGLVYEVKHNHKIGSCTGRLLISGDRVTYESVTELNDSRQWSLGDIQEVKRSSPYQVQIKPFVGNTYDFNLIGQGMDSTDYKQLVDRIASARARQ